MKKRNVLFVCLGNICRSPTAEGIFQKQIESLGFSSSFRVDSAGTSAHHQGEMADFRMREAALEKGYELKSISRKFTQEDFDKFDYILAMDRSNEKNILTLSRSELDKKKVYLMTSFCSKFKLDEVPDPYFGGEDGFYHVIDILEDAIHGLLNKIKGET